MNQLFADDITVWDPAIAPFSEGYWSQKNLKQITKDIHWFSFSWFSKHAAPLPPHLDFTAHSFIGSVRKSGLYSLLHYKRLISLRIWYRRYFLYGKPPSNHLTLPCPFTPSYSKVFSFFCVLPLLATRWCHKIWIMWMSSIYAAPHFEFTVSLRCFYSFWGEGLDNRIRLGWTKEGWNRFLILFYVY